MTKLYGRLPPPKDWAEYQQRVAWAKMNMNPEQDARRLGVRLSTRVAGGIDISGSDRRSRPRPGSADVEPLEE